MMTTVTMPPSAKSTVMDSSHTVTGGDIGDGEQKKSHAHYDHHGVEHFPLSSAVQALPAALV
jgi:hypothetical protein